MAGGQENRTSHEPQAAAAGLVGEVMTDPAGAGQVLGGLRVIDLSRWVAGEYATKLFADLGAEVIKVEKPREGSLTRYWGPSLAKTAHSEAESGRSGPDGQGECGIFKGESGSAPETSALFLHLNTNKSSIALDLTDPTDRDVLLALIREADALVESFRPGKLEELGLGPQVLHAANPALVITRISAYGQNGPYRDREATGIVLQASGGPMNATGQADRAPLRKPGLLEHYTIGRSAAAVTLAGIRAAAATRRGSVIDVAGNEVLLAGADRRASYLLSASYSGIVAPRGARSPHRHGATFTGPFRTRDGFVMVYVTNIAFWNRLIWLISGGDSESEIAFRERFLDRQTVAGQDREDFLAAVAAWIGARDKLEVMEQAEAARIPITAYLTVREVLANEHYRQREVFTELEHPAVGTLEYLATPWRMRDGFALHRPAPLLDQHGAELRERAARVSTASGAEPDEPDASAPAAPLAGVRVVDLTVVWSGPGGTALLGDLGAEVIRPEGNNRVSRQVSASTTKESIAKTGYHGGTYPERDPGERPYDRTALFNWHSRNKLSASMNLETPEGRQAFEKLIAISDVLVENNSAGVLEKLGIGHQELLALNPRLIVVRMPPMGMSGPMSSYLGYGPNFNSLVGIAAMDGYAGDDPDSAGENYHMDEAAPAGVAMAVLAGLRDRDSTGRGGLIEFAQAENVMAELGEYVLDAQVNDRDPLVLGNRDPYWFQDVFATADETRWVAISVADRHWPALAEVFDDPELAELADQPRGAAALDQADHDRLVERLTAHTRGWEAAELAAALQAHRVPAAEVMSEVRLLDDPQLLARDWFQERHHPHVGTYRYPGHQWRADGFDLLFGRVTCGFGEDNEYVYRDLLGYSDEEYDDLVQRGLVTDHQLA